MIVAYLEDSLILQAQPNGIRLLHSVEQSGDHLVIIDLDSPIQLVQMVLSQADQRGKHHGGRGAGRVEITILDRRIDAGIGPLLQRFQHCEQPPQPVRQKTSSYG